MILPEAGDVDITQQEVLVAVGRGIQQKDNLEPAEELAQALGGAVCASRPVIDQGWRCLRCEYNLTGLAGDTCPECGERIDWDTVREAADESVLKMHLHHV